MYPQIVLHNELLNNNTVNADNEPVIAGLWPFEPKHVLSKVDSVQTVDVEIII